jgi:hypothetical protein
MGVVVKAVLLKGASEYNVLRYAIDDIAEAFAARGWQAEIVDVSTIRDHDTLRARLRPLRPADLVFSFMILGDYVKDGETVSNLLGCPHVVQCVDYPPNHMKRFIEMQPQCALLLVDKSHGAVVDQVFGPDHFAALGFNPHGGIGTVAPRPADAAGYAAERPIAMLFAGSLPIAGEPRWKHLPGDVQNICSDAADLALSVEWMAAHDALSRVLTAHGFDLEVQFDAEERQAVRMMAGYVHEWVRYCRRRRFFAVASRLGLPLTVYGKGHAEFSSQFSGFDYRGPAEWRELVTKMRESRLVIGVNANFGLGSHERPLSAMLAGAAAACDTTGFFAREFEDGREIALFRWMDLDEDLARIGALAQDADALFAMARAGQAKAAAKHRWADRLEAIIAAADTVRAKHPEVATAAPQTADGLRARASASR